MKQLKMNFLNDYKKQFGGELLIGKRKTQRPLSVKKPIHLVIRSDTVKLFKPSNLSLEKLIFRLANKFQIRIYDLALNWSHIHTIILIKNRKNYVRFIRALTSLIATKIRSKLSEIKKVFILRPFTRIVEWGKDFKNVKNYVYLNHLEALGYNRRKNKHEVKIVKDRNYRIYI